MWIVGVPNLTVVLLLIEVLIQPASAQCPPRYDVQALYGPVCPFKGYAPTNLQAINDSGVACGVVGECASNGRMVIWDGQNPPATIPLPPNAASAGPYAINDFNEIVGTWNPPNSPERAFLGTTSWAMDLGTLPDDLGAWAYAISSTSTIVGYSGGTSLRAVMWQNGDISAFDLPMGPSSIARDISSSGTYICGWMGIDPNPHFGSHAFLWHNGDVVDLGVLAGTTSSEARGVNNLGQVCGIAYTPVGDINAIRHGFFWSDGVMHDIGVLPGYTHSIALDLNDSGQVVGYSFNNGREAFVWQNGVLSNLNALISPELNLTIRIAWGVNNAGQIAALAIDKDANQIGVILTPIPPIPGDVTCDWRVDHLDLLQVIFAWGECPAPVPPLDSQCPADFNHDGRVNVQDLLFVINHWSAN